MSIVGIDLSLTGTGLARMTSIGMATYAVETAVVISAAPKNPRLQDHFDRQTKISSAVLEFALGQPRGDGHPDAASLVVIEGLFNSGQVGGSLIDRAGLWWRIVGSLLCYDIPVVTAAPMQGKKFLTGAGNADKGAMAMYAAKLYPQWTPSTMKNANDEADAIALASIGVGLQRSDDEWPFQITDYRQKIIDDINKKQKLREPA